jgi:hypothetical protein
LFFLASPPKEPNPDYGFLEFFHKNFTKPISGLVRLTLSPRESRNFRPLRKAMKVAHFGFPPSAGPESGQATAPFK